MSIALTMRVTALEERLKGMGNKTSDTTKDEIAFAEPIKKLEKEVKSLKEKASKLEASIKELEHDVYE